MRFSKFFAINFRLLQILISFTRIQCREILLCHRLIYGHVTSIYEILSSHFLLSFLLCLLIKTTNFCIRTRLIVIILLVSSFISNLIVPKLKVGLSQIVFNFLIQSHRCSLLIIIKRCSMRSLLEKLL